MKKTMIELLNTAKKHHFAVAAPNVFNLESIEAAFNAAHILKAPIILNIGAIHGIEKLSHIIQYYDEIYPDVIYAINLDHGKNIEEVKLAIKSGFSSVMIDYSMESFEDNLNKTKDAVKIAHEHHISVEAELGNVGQQDVKEDLYTDPTQAKQFIQQTNVDCLAVAIGTTHGLYKNKPNIDFKRLKKLNDTLQIPLVLHGGSSTGDENLVSCIDLGIRKINLFTDLGNETIDKLNLWINSSDKKNLLKQYSPIEAPKENIHQLINFSFRFGYQEKLMHYMKLFRSQNTSQFFE